MTVNYLPCYPTYYTKGRSRKIEFIVIHYTANLGDSAKNNASYFSRNEQKRIASSHYFVDENSVWQSVKDEDTANHCGGSLQGNGSHPFYGVCFNSNSIGIEICMNDRKCNVRMKSIENAAKLTVELMRKYGIDSDHVIRHYDVTAKTCPAPMVSNPSLWAKFKDMIKEDDMTEAEVRKIVRDEYNKILKEIEKQPASAWAAKEWAVAKAAGITDGTMPRAPLTREQYVIMESRKNSK